MDDLKWALGALKQKRTEYRLFNDYYHGKHRLAFATEKFRNAFGSLFSAFADNLCPATVDPLANKLQITGFDGSLGEAAGTLWADKTIGMYRLAGEIHTEALAGGDAYLFVWPDAAGRPVFYANRAELVRVQYDEEQPGRMNLAVKHWATADKYIRVNLYYPDRIEKYITLSKNGELPDAPTGLTGYQVDGEPWPLPNPFGQIPVFHFANNARMGEYGRSELVDVLPLQDALNKTVTDMLVAMEFVALPQRWATGLEVDIDDTTGKPVTTPFTPGADRVWAVGSPDTRFGQFDPANLAQFTQVQESFRLEIARVKGLPLYYLALGGSSQVSGEALKVLESRFVATILDRQESFGETWCSAIRFALQVSNQPNAGDLSVLWADPASRNETEYLQGLTIKKDLGVSENQLLLEAGYTQEQIDQMQAEKETSGTDMADKLIDGFNKGR